jgi:hypothetical protein
MEKDDFDRPPEIADDYWEPLWPGKPILSEEDPLLRTGETWCNDKCQVFVYDHESPEEGWPPYVVLSLKLNSREPWSDWRDFYRIKTELCGTLCWAMELYPPQHALVDTANQYHMFVLPPGVHFPMALKQMAITDYSPEWIKVVEHCRKLYGEDEYKEMMSRAKQREWLPHHICDELNPIGPVWQKRGYYINDAGEVAHRSEEVPKEAVAEGGADDKRRANRRNKKKKAASRNKRKSKNKKRTRK